jgi:glutaredoxin
MIINLTFYTTDGCHLCEEAKVLLLRLTEQRPDRFQLKVIDIVESESLINKYGVRIPVVTKDQTDEDLGWPFSYDDLLNYVA